MSANGDDRRKELAMQLATGFAGIALDYLPAMEEGVRRSGKKISFSARVEVWQEDDLILGRLASTAPKIPTHSRPNVDFVLQMDRNSGQLELIFEGTPRAMKQQLEENAG